MLKAQVVHLFAKSMQLLSMRNSLGAPKARKSVHLSTHVGRFDARRFEQDKVQCRVICVVGPCEEAAQHLSRRHASDPTAVTLLIMPAMLNARYFRESILPLSKRVWFLSPALVMPEHEDASMMPSVALLLTSDLLNLQEELDGIVQHVAATDGYLKEQGCRASGLSFERAWFVDLVT